MYIPRHAVFAAVCTYLVLNFSGCFYFRRMKIEEIFTWGKIFVVIRSLERVWIMLELFIRPDEKAYRVE